MVLRHVSFLCSIRATIAVGRITPLLFCFFGVGYEETLVRERSKIKGIEGRAHVCVQM